MADTSIGTESNGTSNATELIPLSAAAKTAPGRPSANAVWRWCRKGVRSRGGEYIRLRHVRLGGRVFTSLAWLAEFGEQLAAADAQHFDQRIERACPGARAPRMRSATAHAPPTAVTHSREARMVEIEHELTREGL